MSSIFSMPLLYLSVSLSVSFLHAVLLSFIFLFSSILLFFIYIFYIYFTLVLSIILLSISHSPCLSLCLCFLFCVTLSYLHFTPVLSIIFCAYWFCLSVYSSLYLPFWVMPISFSVCLSFFFFLFYVTLSYLHFAPVLSIISLPYWLSPCHSPPHRSLPSLLLTRRAVSLVISRALPGVIKA